MTGIERVRRAVLFQGPDRVPRALPDPWGSDFLLVGPAPDPAWKPAVDGEDEWGCVWQRDASGRTMGQVKVHPLQDYARLGEFHFPNYDVPARYEAARRQVAENREGKFVLASNPLSLVQRLEYLRGHAAAWTDLYEYPAELERLLDKLADIALDAVKHLAAAGAHGILSFDDWGLQDRPMVSPALFRRFWKPRYARVYRVAREHGMLCFLHSCGHIMDLLDDLIEAGLHVIQMDQQENMGVEALARRFGGRIAFWCPVDIQQTMVTGSIDDVRQYARRLIERFGCYNGGFLSKWYPAPLAVSHAQEKIAAMSQAFLEFGGWPEPREQL